MYTLPIHLPWFNRDSSILLLLLCEVLVERNNDIALLCRSTGLCWRNWCGLRLSFYPGRFFQSNRFRTVLLLGDLTFCVKFFESDDCEIFNQALLDFLQTKVICIELGAGGGEEKSVFKLVLRLRSYCQLSCFIQWNRSRVGPWDAGEPFKLQIRSPTSISCLKRGLWIKTLNSRKTG
jgi:hypothetical protein